MILRTVDAHAGGGPLRLVVEGFPSPQGRTMAEKAEWVLRHADGLRRSLMLEPRGHADMCGAVLTEPVTPGSHAGVLFFDNAGCSTMSGHGIIATTTIAFERRLVMPGGDNASIVFDTPAGAVRAVADVLSSPPNHLRVERVRFVNVPSFVLRAGIPVQAGARRLRADLAYGGALYAIVDSEAAGVALDAAHVPELRRTGAAITRAMEGVVNEVHGTIFTGPAHDEDAGLRGVAVFGDGQIDRSPCGAGASAVMAVIDAMGLVDGDRPFVLESIIGTTISARVVGRTTAGDYPAVTTEIEGTAWITGEHTFVIDDDDPLKDGFRV